MNAKLGHHLNTTPSSNNFILNKSNAGKSIQSDEKVYLREKFIPPEISIINYFLKKVSQDQKKIFLLFYLYLLNEFN